MKKAEWREHIERQLESGLGVAEYCRAEGLNAKAFGYQKSVQKRGFVQVSGREPLEVHLPEGVSIRIPSGDIQQLRTVLEALNISAK